MLFRSFILLLLIVAVACNTTDSSSSTDANTATTLERFEEEILNFEKQNIENGTATDVIVFTGSSSIRMWSSLAEDLSEFKVVNRGFGGSTLPELNHYFDRIIMPHTPEQLVVYCGENDIADGATAEEVFASFKTFMSLVVEKLPKTKVYYLPMKPSLARWNLWKEYQRGNEMIQSYCDNNDRVQYVDISVSMLDANGEVKKDIFIEDGLHMNAKGYEGWTEIVGQALR